MPLSVTTEASYTVKRIIQRHQKIPARDEDSSVREMSVSGMRFTSQNPRTHWRVYGPQGHCRGTDTHRLLPHSTYKRLPRVGSTSRGEVDRLNPSPAVSSAPNYRRPEEREKGVEEIDKITSERRKKRCSSSVMKEDSKVD